MKPVSAFSFGVFALVLASHGSALAQSSTPSPSGEPTVPGQMLTRLRGMGDRLSELRELSKRIQQLPVEELARFQSELEDIVRQLRSNANLRKEAASLLMALASRSRAHEASVMQFMSDVLFKPDSKEDERQDYDYRFVRETVIRALSEHPQLGGEMLKKAALSGLNGSAGAVLVLGAEGRADAEFLGFLVQVATHPAAHPYARAEAMWQVLNRFEKISDPEVALGSIFDSLKQEWTSGRSEVVLTAMLRLMSLSAAHPRRSEMARLLLEMHSHPDHSNPGMSGGRLIEPLYVALVAHSEDPRVLDRILSHQTPRHDPGRSGEPRETVAHASLMLARSRVLYLRDGLLSETQKIDLWTGLLEHIELSARESRATRASGELLQGMRLSWSLNLVPAHFGSASGAAYGALPLFLQRLNLIEIPQKKTSVSGVILLGVLTGGMSFFIDPTARGEALQSSGCCSTVAYYNLREALEFDPSDLAEAKREVVRLIRALPEQPAQSGTQGKK